MTVARADANGAGSSTIHTQPASAQPVKDAVATTGAGRAASPGGTLATARANRASFDYACLNSALHQLRAAEDAVKEARSDESLKKAQDALSKAEGDFDSRVGAEVVRGESTSAGMRAKAALLVRAYAGTQGEFYIRRAIGADHYRRAVVEVEALSAAAKHSSSSYQANKEATLDDVSAMIKNPILGVERPPKEQQLLRLQALLRTVAVRNAPRDAREYRGFDPNANIDARVFEDVVRRCVQDMNISSKKDLEELARIVAPYKNAGVNRWIAER